MAPVLKFGLSASSIQKNLPRDLLYGPVDVQGSNIHHPFYTQLIQRLLAILWHGTQPTITGHLLRCGMEQLTLELGTGTPFWQLPPELWSVLATSGWLKSTWLDLAATKLTLQGPLPTLPLLRAQDKFLSDCFIRAGYRKGTLYLLNLIRMALQVI